MTAAVRVAGCTCDGCNLVDRKVEANGTLEQYCLCGGDARTYEYVTKDGRIEHSNGYCLTCLLSNPEIKAFRREVIS